MKRILGCFALIVIPIVLALGILGWILPDHWSVEEQVLVESDPAPIYAILEDVGRWPEWIEFNPPGGKYEASFQVRGSERGAGAVLEWSSEDPGIGNGSFTLTKVDPATGVHYDVFIERGSLRGQGSITFATTDSGTVVTWQDRGELPKIVGGLMSWMMNAGMKRKFAHDLRNLKQLVETGEVTGPAPPPSPSDPNATPSPGSSGTPPVGGVLKGTSGG